ncbi:MAG: LPXTG cell wall anchor domain-containing protein [Coriobacteriales bacterium]|jgi:LPXTG-motif cell wall-anchored protein|nr:LPXTG cell wall anchor domain-containing protein [Coriobacteriales bacterium]
MIQTLYHYTCTANAKRILDEGMLRAGADGLVFLTSSLEECRLVFAQVMREGARYYQADRTIQVRGPVNPDDYVILEVELDPDGHFGHLAIPHAPGIFSAYDYSLIHRGNCTIKRARMLPVIQPEWQAVTRLCPQAVQNEATRKQASRPLRTLLAAACCGALVLGMLSAKPATPAFAVDSAYWTDAGNHDETWYQPGKSLQTIVDADDLAGLAYLVNFGGIDFDAKIIAFDDDIDLSAHHWTLIDSSFAGTIEGFHHIITLAPSDFALAQTIFETTPAFYIGSGTLEYEAAPSNLISVSTPANPPAAAYGTPNNAAALALPTMVTVQTDDGAHQVAVDWDASAAGYDTSLVTRQVFSYHGVIALPADILNPFAVSLELELEVTVLAKPPAKDEGGELPATGDDVFPALSLAGILTIISGALVARGRKALS